MREIGHLENEAQARTFGDFLYVQGVENQVEQDEAHGWAVWIHAEDELERAAMLLAEFRADPANERYQSGSAAKKLRAQAKRDHEAYVARQASSRAVLHELHSEAMGVVTFALVGITTVVFLLQQLPATQAFVREYFYVTEFRHLVGYIEYLRGLPEIRHGQIWRLWTPMFLHGGFMHILGNMLWLRDLGGMIERRQGSWLLLAQVLVIAALSNFGQYLVGGPAFGGMSGVVFGLFGYVWMRAKFSPLSGYVLHPTIVVMQLVWLVLCFTGLVGSIANTCHVVGLVVGVVWGWLASRRWK